MKIIKNKFEKILNNAFPKKSGIRLIVDYIINNQQLYFHVSILKNTKILDVFLFPLKKAKQLIQKKYYK